MLKRWASLILLVAAVAFGTGALEYVHNITHLRIRQMMAELRNPHHVPAADSPARVQDNCGLNVLLHLPMLPAAAIPLLILAGLFVAFLTLLAPELISASAPARIDCRGPPWLGRALGR